MRRKYVPQEKSKMRYFLLTFFRSPTSALVKILAWKSLAFSKQQPERRLQVVFKLEFGALATNFGALAVKRRRDWSILEKEWDDRRGHEVDFFDCAFDPLGTSQMYNSILLIFAYLILKK